MVLKVKVSHQANDADVAGIFHHSSNLLHHFMDFIFLKYLESIACLWVAPLTVPTCIFPHFVAPQQTWY